MKAKFKMEVGEKGAEFWGYREIGEDFNVDQWYATEVQRVDDPDMGDAISFKSERCGVKMGIGEGSEIVWKETSKETTHRITVVAYGEEKRVILVDSPLYILNNDGNTFDSYPEYYPHKGI